MSKPDPFEEWISADESFYQLAVRYLKHDKVISEEEYESLQKMLKSPDTENHILAREVINVKDNNNDIRY